MSRLAVPKTYKLYIGGKFPRSESGRTYEVTAKNGSFLANAAKASRKDARDAVVAARSALSGWSGATPYNRGQVLYRIAELLEGRRVQFVDEIAQSEGVSAEAATRQVDEAIDRWVWYAGWADKYVQVAGNANPVSGPYFNLSVPEPAGVVAIVAPQGAGSLLGLVSVVAPALVAGNTVSSALPSGVNTPSTSDPACAVIVAVRVASAAAPRTQLLAEYISPFNALPSSDATGKVVRRSHDDSAESQLSTSPSASPLRSRTSIPCFWGCGF